MPDVVPTIKPAAPAVVHQPANDSGRHTTLPPIRPGSMSTPDDERVRVLRFERLKMCKHVEQ
jgi:hypothetical protein